MIDESLRRKLIEDPLLRDRRHVFEDRVHAGRLLAGRLGDHGYGGGDTIVLAIPSGGVPVGYVVSRRLRVPFDVIIVRKIHVPWNREAGFGAITWDGITVLNETLVRMLGLTRDVVEKCIADEREDLLERVGKFRRDRAFPDLRERGVVLVDDGLASGYTMLAAVKSVRRRSPGEVVVAVPTSSVNALRLIARRVDRIFCLNVRGGPIFAVADAYELWYDLSDDEVLVYLKASGLID